VSSHVQFKSAQSTNKILARVIGHAFTLEEPISFAFGQRRGLGKSAADGRPWKADIGRFVWESGDHVSEVQVQC
jgi:hypothetical protein